MIQNCYFIYWIKKLQKSKFKIKRKLRYIDFL